MIRTVKEVRRALKAARRTLGEMETQFAIDIDRYARCGVRREAVRQQQEAGQAVIEKYRTEVVEDLENELCDLQIKEGDGL